MRESNGKHGHNPVKQPLGSVKQPFGSVNSPFGSVKVGSGSTVSAKLKYKATNSEAF